MVAERTNHYIIEKLVELLVSEFKFSREEATTIVNKTWRHTPDNMQIKPTGDLGSRFNQLRKQKVSTLLQQHRRHHFFLFQDLEIAIYLHL